MIVYFASNRNRTLQRGKVGMGDRFHTPIPEIRFGSVEVNKRRGEWRAAAPDIAPESSRLVTNGPVVHKVWRVTGSQRVFEQIQKQARDPGRGDIFVFLHGAANSFADAAEVAARCAELYSDSARPLIPLIFSYPTNGRGDPGNYFQDRDDATLSGPALGRAYGRLVQLAMTMRDQRCDRKVHLLAHSLGNFALRQAVQSVTAHSHYPKIRLFDTVFLAHADEDADTLHDPSKMLPLTRLANEIVVYFDRTDKLLRLSDAVHIDRLGQNGPARLDSPVVDGCRISAVDCEAVDFDLNDDSQRHRHYFSSSAVVDDIKNVLAGGEPESIPGRTPVSPPGFYRLG